MGWKSLVAVLAGFMAPLAFCGCPTTCGNYNFQTAMDDTLIRDGSHAVPIYIYFVPKDKSKVGGVAIDEWFKSPLDSNDRIDRRFLISTKAVAGGTIQGRLLENLPEKVEKICIWAGKPSGPSAAEAKPERFQRTLDPKNIQGCSFDITVKSDGLLVRTNGVEVMEGVP